jgi:hypothetical protein
MENWLQAHETFLGDLPLLDRGLLIIYYEDLIARPAEVFGEISKFLELDSPIEAGEIRPNLNSGYAHQWQRLQEASSIPGRLIRARHVANSYVERVRYFGYDLHDFSTAGGLPVPPSTGNGMPV